jgi:hypothetical protein
MAWRTYFHSYCLYYPPMSLSLVFPMGLLPFTLTVHLWASIMFGLALESCVLCYGLFRSISKQSRIIKLILAFFFLTFFPFYTSFYFGQLSLLLLFALVIALICFNRNGQKLIFRGLFFEHNAELVRKDH